MRCSIFCLFLLMISGRLKSFQYAIDFIIKFFKITWYVCVGTVKVMVGIAGFIYNLVDGCKKEKTAPVRRKETPTKANSIKRENNKKELTGTTNGSLIMTNDFKSKWAAYFNDDFKLSSATNNKHVSYAAGYTYTTDFNVAKGYDRVSGQIISITNDCDLNFFYHLMSHSSTSLVSYMELLPYCIELFVANRSMNVSELANKLKIDPVGARNMISVLSWNRLIQPGFGDSYICNVDRPFWNNCKNKKQITISGIQSKFDREYATYSGKIDPYRFAIH